MSQAGSIAAPAPPNPQSNGHANFGINYDSGSGVFTVNSSDGTPLSLANKGIVTLNDKDDLGSTVSIDVTANQSFIDDGGASEIIGNLFGLPTLTAYSEDLPFFLYAVSNNDQDTIQFMISRINDLKTSPAAALIGSPSSAVADVQQSFFSFDNITETDFDLNPCLMIGSFRMQMSASDDWTVQTLDQSDGIGFFQRDRDFTFPTGAFGASTSTHFLANGGVAPVFPVVVYTFRVLAGGLIDINLFNFGVLLTAGVGAVTLLTTIPYIPTYPGGGVWGTMYSAPLGVGNSTGTMQALLTNNVQTRDNAGALLQNGNFTAGFNQFYMNGTFKALT